MQHFHSIIFQDLKSHNWNPITSTSFVRSEAHLTSHSRMSGSGWVIIPSWLYGSWRSFLYSSSLYSCHLFLISSASVRSLPFLSFIEPIFAWHVPLVSLLFLKRSLVFPILFFSSLFCIDCWGRLSYVSWLFFGTLHSNGNIFPFLLCFSLLFTTICKASSDSHFAFIHFSSMGMVLIPVSCTMPTVPVLSFILSVLFSFQEY